MNDNKKIVSFGEIMQRLSPSNGSNIENARLFEAYYGGSEANVLIALASMNNSCSYITVLPDNELGRAAKKHLEDNHVDTKFIKLNGDILGVYYFEQGFGSLSSNVIYNRSQSEIAKISIDKIALDYDRVFEDCAIFHISGISFALSESCKEVCFELLKQAKKRNIPVSFDFNYRSKLWSIEKATTVYKEIVEYVDLLLCSAKDLTEFLGVGVNSFYEKYNCEYLVVRDRIILKNNLHKVRASIFKRTAETVEAYSQPKKEFISTDRVGSGDAFDAGVIHEFLKSGNIKKMLDFGMAAFIVKHSIRGDALNLSEGEILNWMKKNED